MAYKGPGDRTITLDTWAGVPTDITYIVRSIEGVEDSEPVIEDATDVGDVRPTRRPSGFIETKEIQLELSQDTGGAYDARAQLLQHVGDNSATLTLLVTYSAGKTWAIEAYIGACKVNTPGKNETTLSVTLLPTGAPTTAF